MKKIIIIGAGAMGCAFAVPCVDNKNDVTIVGTLIPPSFRLPFTVFFEFKKGPALLKKLISNSTIEESLVCPFVCHT